MISRCYLLSGPSRYVCNCCFSLLFPTVRPAVGEERKRTRSVRVSIWSTIVSGLCLWDRVNARPGRDISMRTTRPRKCSRARMERRNRVFRRANRVGRADDHTDFHVVVQEGSGMFPRFESQAYDCRIRGSSVFEHVVVRSFYGCQGGAAL